MTALFCRNPTTSEAGTVTVENTGLGGVTVVLSGMSDATTATDNSGQYAFTGLRAGSYSVEISGFDMDEVGFGNTSSAATVGVGESKIISFDGTYLRTAGIMGQVSVEGEGLAGVTVTMTGEGEDQTDVTDAGGLYGFSKLKAGDYSVAISGYDTDDYEFATTSMNVAVATGETANIPFEGTLLRTSGISGRVSLDDGMGLDGVEVVLAGAAEATYTTANGGQYAFAGLAEGTYVVSMTNPNADAYTFDETSATVVLGDAESNITNFEGTHTRTASISGVLFIDEVGVPDKMLTDGEPTITEALAPWLAIQDDETKAMVAGLLTQARVIIRGPSLNDPPTEVQINAHGTFTTGEALPAGSYQVELPANNEMVAAALAAAGVAFVGESAVVTVEAAGEATVNFPFRITMQTVVTGARMGGGGHFAQAVEGVKLALYGRADGTGMLGEATTKLNEATGFVQAAFNFARADDTSPGSEDGDNIVFVKVVESGHPALVVSGNEFVEIAYKSTARLYAAHKEREVATLVNVAVSFDFWVKSNETARDGNEGLGGWSTAVVMVDSEDPTMTSDSLVNATAPTDDGEDDMDNLGKSTFSHVIDPTMLGETGITFAVAAVPVVEGLSVQPDQGEMWEQSDPLVHTHTGLELPPGEDDDMLDLGPIRITYLTQAVYVGAHRELDDRTGYTDFIGLGDGDARPDGDAVGEIEVSVMVADSRGRLNVLEYDHDMDDETDDEEATATFGASGMVSFAHIPADMEITIVADAGSGMVIVPDTRASSEFDAFGEQLDDYPDGKIVGAYGDGSGARADVWICPLWRLDHEDMNDNCSTFAYKWADGTISGDISGLRKGDKATVTLTPVNSNDDYSDDLEDEEEVTAGNGGAADYSFEGVADGRYTVVLEANPGSWEEDDVKGISVMHDEEEGDDDDEYSGDVQSGKDLSATDLRGTIRGRIANDSNSRTGLTGDESRSGVVVAVHKAVKVGGSGTTKNNYKDGGAVTDADGDPVMAETDEDGVFMFEGLVVGNKYLVKPQETDLYTAVRNGNTSIGATAEEADDVVTHALATAGLPPRAGTEPGIPTWNYHTNTATVGTADFVLLYKNGEVEGEVSDPSVREAHQYATVELYRCLTTDYRPAVTDPDPDPTDEVPLTGCEKYVDRNNPATANVGDDGEWIAEDLMEGIYEVVVDLPAGYVHVDSEGNDPEDTGDFNTGGDNEGTYFSQQAAELMGGRADAGTETFHIKDRNAGGAVVIESILIDGDACGVSEDDVWQAPEDRCVDNDHDDGSITVRVTASDGATIRLSSSADDATPSGTGTQSAAVSNGRNTTVSLATGQRQFFVHVSAENGYSDNSDVTGENRDFEVRRDADVRVNEVTISWTGDRIELDRSELGLDPDGETDPVTGTTTLRYTLDEGDGGDTAPATALGLAAVGMNTKYDFVQWSEPAGDGSCVGVSYEDVGNEVTVGSTSGDDDSVCFRILDSASDLDDGDSNGANFATYLLIVTRD